MEPVSASFAAEAAVGVIGALVRSRHHLQRLVDAVRGAHDTQSMWYRMCSDLADYCTLLLPMLQGLESEMRQGTHTLATRNRLEDCLQVVSSAVRDGTELVTECQTASTATLFFRGESLKEKFRKVTERIAQSLLNIPLAAYGSTLELKGDVRALAQSLENARFELSEEDKALFQDVREAVSNQGVQSQAQHADMLSVIQQMEARLKMQVSDMRQELQASLGDGAVDLEAKEQKFLDQIVNLLAQSSVEAGPSSSSPTDAGASKGKAAARQHKFGHPEHYLCPITLELMLDPVVDANGHTFERRAITMALMHRPGVSPKTNKPYLNGEARLLPNYATKHAIEAYREEHGIEAGDGGAAEAEAEAHAAHTVVEIREEVEIHVPTPTAGGSELAAAASSGAGQMAHEAGAPSKSVDPYTGGDHWLGHGMAGRAGAAGMDDACVVSEVLGSQEEEDLLAAAERASQLADAAQQRAVGRGAAKAALAPSARAAPAAGNLAGDRRALDAAAPFQGNEGRPAGWAPGRRPVTDDAPSGDVPVRTPSAFTGRRMLLLGLLVAALVAIVAGVARWRLAAAGTAAAAGSCKRPRAAPPPRPSPPPSPPPAPPPWSLVRTLDDPTSYVYGVAYAPDGDTLAAACDDGKVYRWDAATGAPRTPLTGHSSGWVFPVAFSGDSRLLASGGVDMMVRVYDQRTDAYTLNLTGHSGYVYALAFAPDDEILVSGSSDSTAKVWAVATGELLTTLTGHTLDVRGLAFAPDGRTLATASVDDTVKLWRTEDWTLLRTLSAHSGSTVWAVAYSPDGAVLATGSRDSTVRLWDPETGTALHTITHSSNVVAVAFSPDGAFLATGGSDRTVRVWSALDGWSEVITTLNGHSSTVNGLAFAPGGRHLASCSYDGTVKIWQVPA